MGINNIKDNNVIRRLDQSRSIFKRLKMGKRVYMRFFKRCNPSNLIPWRRMRKIKHEGFLVK